MELSKASSLVSDIELARARLAADCLLDVRVSEGKGWVRKRWIKVAVWSPPSSCVEAARAPSPTLLLLLLPLRTGPSDLASDRMRSRSRRCRSSVRALFNSLDRLASSRRDCLCIDSRALCASRSSCLENASARSAFLRSRAVRSTLVPRVVSLVSLLMGGNSSGRGAGSSVVASSGVSAVSLSDEGHELDELDEE